MLYKISYTNSTDRLEIINDNADKWLIEEQNITEGNFLIFTDIKPDELILQDLQKDIQIANSKLNALNDKTNVVEGAVFELATMVLE